MKRIFTLFAGLLIFAAIFSQTPQRISYQAVIRDNTNQLVTSQQVGMRISILWGSADGSVVYSETQTPETNHSGLVGIEIGGGAGFSSIDWSAGPYFIKTETDPAGGNDYTITGISQLLTVPYALHAKTADNISGGISIDYSELTGTPVLSAVAESGNYNDLLNTPDLAAIALSGEYSELIGAPEITDVAISGDYSDLSGIPSLSAVALTGTFSDLLDRPSTLLGYGITDAMSTSHAANGISSVDITSWNAAHSWGDHNEKGYLSGITGQPLGDLADVDLTGLGAGNVLKYDLAQNKWIAAEYQGVSSEADPVFNSSVSSGIVAGDIENWNAAHQWGDHSAEGYLLSESDPVFSAHSASGIVSAGSGNVISVEERSKLTGIEAGANNYVHPGTHPASMVVEEANLRFLTDAERTKLAAVEAEANKYIHPGTHPASMVVEEANLRFMTDAERTKLEGIETGAQVNVKGDWNAVAGSDAEILNKPALANIATSGSFTDIGDRPSTLSGYGITDAMSTSHAANGITSVDITSWNAAHSWGDHNAKGYLTGITGQPLGDLADVDLTGLDAGNVLKYDLAQGKWIVAADLGITSETDPAFNSSVSSGIVAGDIEDWNAAHLWGDHSAEGYLTSETDPLFTAWDKTTGISITESQISDLKTYLTSETDPVFSAWDKTTGISITESQISDLKTYLTSETDPAVAANFDFSSAAIGDLLMFNGTKWVKHTPDYAASGHTHGAATIAADGFMSATDKIKLDGLQNSDGSETNIIAGDNIAVSGSGTVSDPYIVNVDTGTRYIGEEYGGGIVFYVTPDGKHGLVAAKQDQTLSGAKRWYDAQNVISDPANHDAEGKNYTDWRLPNSNELRLLYEQKAVVGGFTSDQYWSSSEVSYGEAFRIRFYNGYRDYYSKTVTHLIRAVRSF